MRLFMERYDIKTLKDSVFKTTGPVLFDFVCWTLYEAIKKGINTLYFLARDGYVLYKIALKICEAQNLKVECRYLYCSRTALRLPAYHLIGEEAYELLLLGSYYVSRQSILERIYLTQEERSQIYEELGYPLQQEDKLLSYSEFYRFTVLLKSNKTYRAIVEEKSKAAYPAAIGYFRQEKLFAQEHIAIVDSGWSGSMQRCLRQLLSSQGYKGTITGFYFGMFGFFKKDIADGEFCCWYFSEHKALLNKILFCNNLFECFLSAPHGMTLFYEYTGESIKPVLKSPPSEQMLSIINDQIKYMLLYTDYRLNDFSIYSTNFHDFKKRTQYLMRQIMVHPTRAEAILYGQFKFSDDISDLNALSLASNEQIQLLKDNYLIIPRILRKLTGESKKQANQEVFWPHGTAALSGNQLRVGWYRINIFMWDWVKLLITNIKCMRIGYVKKVKR